MRVHYRERALADLDEIFQYIDKHSPSGARNVIDAISAAINAIAEHPLGARETSFPHIHVKVVRRYRYKIFYLVGADQVEILHVRHGARRPWSPEN
jgi:plasmid stabilization system protein ParE